MLLFACMAGNANQEPVSPESRDRRWIVTMIMLLMMIIVIVIVIVGYNNSTIV